MTKIGITERGDAALNYDWVEWVSSNKPAMLITKNILKLARFLKNQIFEKDNLIIHATITGMGGTIIEPNVPELNESIIGLKEILEIIPKEKIVIRIDPIIPTQKGIETAKEVYESTKSLKIKRYRISFLDLYKHVKERFAIENIELPWTEFHAPIELRKKAVELLKIPDVEICGEPDFNCTGCISQIDLNLLKIKEQILSINQQRKECRCLGIKNELLKNRGQCAHQCIYCYWK